MGTGARGLSPAAPRAARPRPAEPPRGRGTLGRGRCLGLLVRLTPVFGLGRLARGGWGTGSGSDPGRVVGIGSGPAPDPARRPVRAAAPEPAGAAARASPARVRASAAGAARRRRRCAAGRIHRTAGTEEVDVGRLPAAGRAARGGRAAERLGAAVTRAPGGGLALRAAELGDARPPPWVRAGRLSARSARGRGDSGGGSDVPPAEAEPDAEAGSLVFDEVPNQSIGEGVARAARGRRIGSGVDGGGGADGASARPRAADRRDRWRARTGVRVPGRGCRGGSGWPPRTAEPPRVRRAGGGEAEGR